MTRGGQSRDGPRAQREHSDQDRAHPSHNPQKIPPLTKPRLILARNIASPQSITNQEPQENQ